jgi:hypothetical protein
MSETRKYDVETVQLGAIRDRKICLIMATTKKGDRVHLNLSGEAMLALPEQVERLRTQCPEIVRWHTQAGE